MASIGPYYDVGTASLTVGSASVTGQGTSWLTARLRPGDQIESNTGQRATILSVNSNTSITLDRNYAGTAQTAAAYKIWRTPDALEVLDKARAAFDLLGSGSVAAWAGLTLAADKLPYGGGPGTLGLTDFPASARSLLGLSAAADKLPFFTSGSAAGQIDFPLVSRQAIANGLGNAATGTMQSSTIDPTTGRVMAVGAFGLGGQDASLPTGTNLNNLGTTQFINPVDAFPGAWDSALGSYPMGFHLQRSATVQSQFAIGFSGTAGFRSKDGASWQAWRKFYHSHNVLGTVGLSGGVPTGGIIERGSNANGSYAKFADGTMICQHVLSVGNITTAAGAVYRGAAATLWTFPASFITSPVICGADPSSYFVWIFSGPTNANDSNIMPFSSASISEARVAALTAIGRWN